MMYHSHVMGTSFNPYFNSKVIGAYESDDVILNGSNVIQLNDKSGNGHHFIQNTPSSQPALNGNTIEFDGVGDSLDLTNIDDFRTLEGEVIAILNCSLSGINSLITMDNDTNDSGADRLMLGVRNHKITIWDETVLTGTLSTFLGYNIISYTNNHDIYVNGTIKANDGSGSGWFGNLNSPTVLTLGRYNFNGWGHVPFWLKALYFFDSTLTTLERSKYIDYFNGKYNIF